MLPKHRPGSRLNFKHESGKARFLAVWKQE
jgi:hypothetical protein